MKPRPSDSRWAERSGGLVIGCGLWLADRLRRPLTWLGVDFPAFRVLLRTRLLLDQRGVPSLGLGAAPSGAARDGGFGVGIALMLSLFWLAGLPVGLLAPLARPPAHAWMAAVSAFALGLFALQLVLFYGSMLLDPTDVGVLQSRPVSDRTLFAARLAHVGVYLLLGCASLSFFPMFLGCLAYPFWAVLPLVPLTIGLSALLALGLVALFHGVVLRLAGPARFQRVSLWLQILMATFLMGGVQLVMPLVRESGVLQALAGRPELRVWAPPFHFGGLFEVLLGSRTPADLQLAAAALLVPAASLALAVLVAGRHFVAGLSGQLQVRAARGARWPGGPLRRLGRRLCRSREEQAAFDFALSLSRRDRIFLRQALPATLGMSIVGLALLLPMQLDEEATFLVPWVLPAAVCFAALAGPTLLEAGRFSEHWAARWIFSALPVSGPRPLLRGGALALLLGWAAPTLIAVALLTGSVAGPAQWPEVLVALLAGALLVLQPLPAMQLRVPFTDQARPNQADFRNVGVMFLFTALVMGTAGLVALAHLHPLALLAAALLAALLLPRAWRGLDRLQVVDPESGRTQRRPRGRP